MSSSSARASTSPLRRSIVDWTTSTGSVVTRDIPAGVVAFGNPCRVIRTLTQADSMAKKPEILGDNRVIPPEEWG